MKNNNLKYLIAGTGGVGGSIAAFLALAGKDVTCIARGGHLAALRENGLKLHSDLKGEHTLDVPAYTAEEYAPSPLRRTLTRQTLFSYASKAIP